MRMYSRKIAIRILVCLIVWVVAVDLVRASLPKLSETIRTVPLTDISPRAPLGLQAPVTSSGATNALTEYIRRCIEEAESGDKLSQYRLAGFYEAGVGIEHDLEKAAHFFRLAAEQGLAEAECELGACLNQGKGIPQNQVEAVIWFRKAAEQGLAPAQYWLGY